MQEIDDLRLAARQLITHGFICVNGRQVSIPSYVVSVAEEPTVSYYKAIDISVPETEEEKKKAKRQNKMFCNFLSRRKLNK